VSENRETPTIKRILVALDASSHSLAGLEAAIDLATRFNAELTGIYVEDENLLRLAELPFVQEVGHFSATRRHIVRADLERQIRGQSRRVRRVFAVATQRAHLRWSFRTVRGGVLSEVLAASTEADLLVLGKQGWSLLRRGRLGSTVWGLLPERFGLALIVKKGTRLAAPMAVIYDGSEVADRALFAAEMVRSRLNNNQSLIVLVLPTAQQDGMALQAQARSRLATRGTATRYRTATGTNIRRLADILLTEGCGTVVLPARSSVLQNSMLAALLDYLELPILLVT